ncbi:hypothetical protein FE257_007623 [Aspergillus nanangensis]|uniref:Uncharacterized protein n=1 Tax=Aspergillus nanangensis TaxID=2582783 RepID=A0AAD4CM93_ASPNN|nr:hypothetical protein FE257_007623 [Aspergillus nanangensis]
MSWFPTTLDSGEQSWRFDIVSLLAVIGGSTIEKHKQSITASPFAGFPRLLPAPDTLLDTDRPIRLPSVGDVVIIGIYSGTRTNELNFFANVIHDAESLAPYEFRSYNITYATPDIEKEDAAKTEINIPVRTLSALNGVTVLSILMTVGLFVWAGVIHDGVALVGLFSMSLSTSTACLSGQWRPRLSKRPTGGRVPPGDLVIKTRGGAFIVVHCREEITRELYAGMDTCQYVFTGRPHQLLLASSTVLLMASIILFSNCGRTMQIAVGVVYIILNILYWAMALLTSPQHTWDMRRYRVEETQSVQTGNYTEVLWRAIRDTGEIKWVKKGDLAPATKYWKGWLKEAQDNCKNENWDAVAAKNRWMNKAVEEKQD